ncbi:MAG: hypothetical protein IKM62_03105 [Kiritimatiellae bacterium]|nr:hypothetical protein [Kiritimatiellia bacterium]
MKKLLMEFGCISAMVALLCSCIGCVSLAEQLVSSDSETRRVATQTYKQLSATEQAIVQKELAQMVNTAEDEEIRMEALKHLEDKAELAKIARSCHDDEVRKYTVRFLVEDQQVLAEIAKADSDSLVRQGAVEKLTDQKVLAEIAKNADSVILSVVIEKLTDQKALADVAKSDKGDFRKKAVEKLRDQQVIGDVAMNAKSDGIREFAANKLDDSHPIKQKYYAEELKNYGGFLFTGSPVYDDIAKLTDQKLLADVAKNAKCYDVCMLVVEKVVEQDLLFDVAMNSNLYKTAEIAASKLKEQKQIIEVLKKSKQRDARLAVVNKVTDVEVLKTLVKTTKKDKDLSEKIAKQINTLNCFDSSTSFEQIEFDKPFTVTHGNIASGNYRLTKNVELVSSIRVAAGDVVRIDLANFSMGGADIIVSKGARLELFNGKIKRTLEHDDLNALVGRAECQIRNEGFLVLENTEVKIRIKNNLGSLRLMEFNFLMTGGTFDTSDKTTIDLTHGYLWGHIVQNGKFIPLSEGQILFKAEGKKVDDVVVVGALPGKFVARLPRGYFTEERPSKIKGMVDLVIIRE